MEEHRNGYTESEQRSFLPQEQRITHSSKSLSKSNGSLMWITESFFFLMPTILYFHYEKLEMYGVKV